MSRIARTLRRTEEANRAAFVPFITAGDPDAEPRSRSSRSCPPPAPTSSRLGIPFSDPMADGPTNPGLVSSRAQAGMTVLKMLELVRRFRKTDNKTPIVLMGYYNPIHAYGTARFAQRCGAKPESTDCITVDLPPEEDEVLRLPAAKCTASTSSASSRRPPTTSVSKIVLDGASGFLYYVSIAGVTGTKTYAESEVRAPSRASSAQRLALRRRIRHQDAGTGRRDRAHSPTARWSVRPSSRESKRARRMAQGVPLWSQMCSNFCASLAKSVHAAQPASVVG